MSFALRNKMEYSTKYNHLKNPINYLTQNGQPKLKILEKPKNINESLESLITPKMAHKQLFSENDIEFQNIQISSMTTPTNVKSSREGSMENLRRKRQKK